MPTQIEVEQYQAVASNIISDVFRTMLSIDVAPVECERAADFPQLTAAIFFAGDWKGALLIECNLEQAFHFTEKLMRVEKPSRVDDDVRDAMGELANMVGGNLKAVLPPGIGISMPSVVEGKSYSIRICGGSQSHPMAFVSDTGTFWVTLVEVLEH